MPHPSPRGSSPFALIVSLLLTAYLAAVTYFLGRDAVSEADDAVQHLLWVLVGAAGLVTFCLLLRAMDERPSGPTGPDREVDEA